PFTQIAPRPPSPTLFPTRRSSDLPRLLRHRLQANRLQIARDAVVQRTRRARFIVQHLVQEHAGVAAEGEFAGQQLVEDDTEAVRSEEHTSELQSRSELVCRLLLEK